MNDDETDAMLTTSEAAELLGITPQAVRDRIRRGAIPAMHVGPNRLALIRREDLTP